MYYTFLFYGCSEKGEESGACDMRRQKGKLHFMAFSACMVIGELLWMGGFRVLDTDYLHLAVAFSAFCCVWAAMVG